MTVSIKYSSKLLKSYLLFVLIHSVYAIGIHFSLDTCSCSCLGTCLVACLGLGFIFRLIRIRLCFIFIAESDLINFNYKKIFFALKK